MFYQFGKKENIRDRMFMILTLLCTFIPLVIAAGFFILLGGNSSEAFRTFGFKFILSTQWDPVQQLYGALPAISGTLVTTVIAVGIAAPLGFITALFLVNAPKWLGYPLSQALDLLAAIPSIIYGMWGLFVLAPVMQDYIQPFLADTLCLGKVPFFGEDYNGFG
ncbi:MAG TPA: phosphate ABC transporter permease subunit PstC, partial [Lentisphaeria bacterium]|nr:phosphate ABC transporter permease subunit PstC [Lentisphaeria bacterium]